MPARLPLHCPAGCGSGGVTLGGCTETWRDPGGQPAIVVAGECRRCGSTVMFAPSPDALERIRVQMSMSRGTVRDVS